MDLTYLEGWENLPGLNLGRKYRHAPIVEAIVEFRVTTPPTLRVEDLAELIPGDDFGAPETIYNVEHKLEVGADGVSSELRDSEVGFAFHQPDGMRRSIQATAGSFVFVARGEYTGWENFIVEVERFWEMYRSVAEPTHVSAIGVRFVNHIPMPPRSIEIKDYLRMSVDIPAYLPQTLTGLFLQVDIPLPNQQAQATVTSTILPGNEHHEFGWLVLDIDVKAPVAGDTSSNRFAEEIRTTLDRLRFAKNYVFEACVTDATRGLMD